MGLDKGEIIDIVQEPPPPGLSTEVQHILTSLSTNHTIILTWFWPTLSVFGCCVRPPIRKAIRSEGSVARSIFILLLFYSTTLLVVKEGQTHTPPPGVPPGGILLSKAPNHHGGHLLLCWLLCISIERQLPPKTGAPPISQFFDGRHFGTPNKGIEWGAPLSLSAVSA